MNDLDDGELFDVHVCDDFQRDWSAGREIDEFKSATDFVLAEERSQFEYRLATIEDEREAAQATIRELEQRVKELEAQSLQEMADRADHS